MPYAIQLAEPSHVEAWVRLREALYTGLLRKDHLIATEKILTEPERASWLAVDDQDACGMIEISLRSIVDGCGHGPVGYVEGIFVDHAHRGRGLSRTLLSTAEQWCREQGCSEIATDVELINQSAQAYATNMGFLETYRVVEYRKSLA